ncbi:hypothetical protein IW261DRAFT_1671885 [Armillaria novae-zelandiae]|uniref:Uncharacterized protein n=1 Tax=Armillaria novae-zelandiae TaxID=153914 RepID=A0AA39NSG5_9AGAR|nr:hypothetical protein IW261DRAFT_1671885 [Armillaria novae-zelandiae]
MTFHNTSTVVPTLALSNTLKTVSGVDISGSSPSKCTDNDEHFTSVIGARPETNFLSSSQYTMTTDGEKVHVNSYSSRHTFADPTTLKEDTPDGSTPIDGMPEYFARMVGHVKRMQEPTPFPSPGFTEKPLLQALENAGSNGEECQGSNNEAPEEQSHLPKSEEVLPSDFSPTGVVSNRTDQDSAGNPVSSPIPHTLSTEDASFNSVSGSNPPPLVDIITSTGAFSVVIANKSSPDHSLHTTQLAYSRAASPTDGPCSPKNAIDDDVPEDTDLDPDMQESGLADYDSTKEFIANDLPLARLEGIKEACDVEEVINFLRGICSDCPEPLLSRVNVVSASGTLTNIVSDAAPASADTVDSGKPTLSLENGRFCTIEHLCKFLEAWPHFVILKIQLFSVESERSLQHNLQSSFNYITHLDIFESAFESINIISDLLRCLPSLTTCSLRNVLIRLETEIGTRFTESKKLKFTNIIVHGMEAHSMGEITKLLFQGDKNTSLFDKSALESLELIWPDSDGGSHPYYVNEEHGRTLPRIHAENIDNGWNTLGFNAPKLEQIRIDIVWDDNWSSECPWAQVLGHLDLSLWKRKSGQWPKLETLILKTHKFPLNINIVGDAFINLFKAEFNEVLSKLTEKSMDFEPFDSVLRDTLAVAYLQSHSIGQPQQLLLRYIIPVRVQWIGWSLSSMLSKTKRMALSLQSLEATTDIAMNGVSIREEDPSLFVLRRRVQCMRKIPTITALKTAIPPMTGLSLVYGGDGLVMELGLGTAFEVGVLFIASSTRQRLGP